MCQNFVVVGGKHLLERILNASDGRSSLKLGAQQYVSLELSPLNCLSHTTSITLSLYNMLNLRLRIVLLLLLLLLLLVLLVLLLLVLFYMVCGAV